MRHNKCKALPGIVAGIWCSLYVLQHHSAFWGLLALLSTCVSWALVGANADYWEARYRSRNWGQGDSRFKQGHGNG